jgi:hypothetical protein
MLCQAFLAKGRLRPTIKNSVPGEDRAIAKDILFMSVKIKLYELNVCLPAVLFVLTLAGCGRGLPANFKELSLDSQILTYGEYLDDHVNPSESARLSIASHGGAAADRMAEYIAGKRSGFPSFEAIMVVEIVQERVCSLQGSSAQRALRDFAERNSSSHAEYTSAKVVLQEIDTESGLPSCSMAGGRGR